MQAFKTESKKLLDLMINSIYTNKEIFLRELISNASDALDKLNFKSLTDPSIKTDTATATIRLSVDKDKRTLSISDNGVGMTKDELDEFLGTIAHSGSEAFKKQNTKDRENNPQGDKDAVQTDAIDIIGQFGVGFYSAFMVADRVRVVSRALGDTCAWAWESNGQDGYEITQEPSLRTSEDAHGTDVILYLKPSTEAEDTDRFLEEWTLKDLVKRYSNYIHHPIQMMVTKSRELPRPADAPEDYKPAYEEYEELETLNSMTPIWKRKQADVSEEEYTEFYQNTFHDWAKPARTISFHTEGQLSYDALLFIPSEAPFDLYSKDYEKGLALYSSRVLIQEKCADLLPDHYNFVRGVVDSADISLNISRETLQQNAQLKAMARRIEKKIHVELVDMLTNDRKGYEDFFSHFGRGLKFGLYSSYGTRADDLGDLMLFWSAREDKLVTLREYAEKMAEGQDKIYYAAGTSRTRTRELPMVQSALEHGFDVLLCTQDIDEFMFGVWRSYRVELPVQTPDDTASEKQDTPQENKTHDLSFTNIAQAGLNFASEEEKEQAKTAQESHKDLLEALKDALKGKVSDVRVSAELAKSPARITASGQVSLEMERVLAQGPDAEHAPRAERILEISATHPVFEKLVRVQEAHDNEKLNVYASLLLDQALLVEGLEIEDPVSFAQHICDLM